MSKKKFSEGLEDLLNDMPSFEDVQLPRERPTEPARKSHGKSFSSDLDAILQEALDESFEKFGTQPSEALAGKSKSREAAYRAPMGGLDSLIRQTIDIKEMTDDEAGGKKRLTVAVDKSKLERLKSIARFENTYLKDIMVSLIDEFLEQYYKDKGLDG